MATYTVDTTNKTITIDLTQLEIDVLLDNYPTLQEAAETLGKQRAFESAKKYTFHRAHDEYVRQYEAGNTANLPNLADESAVMDWWMNSEFYPGTAAEREEGEV